MDFLRASNLKTINKECGDAFYYLDMIQFEKNFIELVDTFKSIYSNFNIAYSYKTNYIPNLCKKIDELGGFAEIVSDMEYEISRSIGVDVRKIIFNGPYKKFSAIKEILLGGGVVNIDNEIDFAAIKKIAKENESKIINVGIRCNFDILDGVLSRFGYDVEKIEFISLLKELTKISNIKIKLLHCHFATRRLETWGKRVVKMLSLVDKYFEECPDVIDLGGGLFGKMQESLKAQFDCHIPSYREYANEVAIIFKEHFKNGKQPLLLVEPGSALVGDSMKFFAKVENIKNVRNKNIATVIGSIYNINPTLNKKNPPIKVIAMQETAQQEYQDLDFGGFTCIESDYLYKGYTGKLAVGDFVVFENIGSYSIVLKPPFILPNFPVIIEEDNSFRIIKRKETFKDLFRTYELIGE